jgi:uncharacterized iron-regulated protein
MESRLHFQIQIARTDNLLDIRNAGGTTTVKYLFTIWILFFIPTVVMATDAFRVFTAAGEPSTMEALAQQALQAEVVFVGEEHDDPTAHRLQLDILRRLASSGPVVLSLEMFETDVQQVLDEYLAGLISEDHLLKSGRAWKNYASDYRPLVEFAKERGIPVVAANAPRRYVNRVSRLGQTSLDVLPASAKHWLPPLPYAEAAEAYAQKFLKLMAKAREQSSADSNAYPTKLLAAQSLWDASMAYSIARSRMRHHASIVLHVNGSFHSEQRLGILNHLDRYRPSTRSLVVTLKSAESYPQWDSTFVNFGDFVILTDPSLPRTFSTPPPGAAKTPAEEEPVNTKEQSK